MSSVVGRWSRALVVSGALLGCSSDREAEPVRDTVALVPVASQGARLEDAALAIVRFLSGAAPLDSTLLADTVALSLALEGGGAETRLARASLMAPDAWVVRSGGGRHSFVPPARLPKVTVKAGRHFNCLDSSLEARRPELAGQPHAGVKLEPDSAGSCLQVWNATFVFDTTAGPPRLVAAVYDQWEW